MDDASPSVAVNSVTEVDTGIGIDLPGSVLQMREATAGIWYDTEYTTYKKMKWYQTIPWGAIGARVRGYD